VAEATGLPSVVTFQHKGSPSQDPVGLKILRTGLRQRDFLDISFKHIRFMLTGLTFHLILTKELLGKEFLDSN